MVFDVRDVYIPIELTPTGCVCTQPIIKVPDGPALSVCIGQ